MCFGCSLRLKAFGFFVLKSTSPDIVLLPSCHCQILNTNVFLQLFLPEAFLRAPLYDSASFSLGPRSFAWPEERAVVSLFFSTPLFLCCTRARHAVPDNVFVLLTIVIDNLNVFHVVHLKKKWLQRYVASMCQSAEKVIPMEIVSFVSFVSLAGKSKNRAKFL